MIHASGKATKLAGTDGEPFSLYLNNNPSLENDEAFIAVLMGMRQRINPCFFGMIVPDLKPIRGKADLVKGEQVLLRGWKSLVTCGDEMMP
jgi:hypothetical protein